jgi:hypothetical protein
VLLLLVVKEKASARTLAGRSGDGVEESIAGSTCGGDAATVQQIALEQQQPLLATVQRLQVPVS